MDEVYKSNPLRVLVVDDSRPYANLVKLLLERSGAQVKACYDPLEALTYARQHPDFDIAVVDLQMPQMDGNRLEYELRRIPGKRDLRVIIPTADEDAVRNYSARLCKRGRTKVLRKEQFIENPKQYLDDVLAA